MVGKISAQQEVLPVGIPKDTLPVTLATGLRNWEYVEVKNGLSAGELVVVSLDRAEVKAGATAVAAEAKP